MASDKEVKVILSAVNNTQRALDDVTKQLKDLGTTSENVKKSQESMTTSVFKGVASWDLLKSSVRVATDFLKDSIKEAEDSARIQSQLNAVLKSTHEVAGMTAKAVNDLSSAIAQNSTIEDDAVTAGQNMLLTFTNIGKDVFPQATQALVDMSVAMNGGATPTAEQLTQTAIQLGKALNDPIIGVTALRRVGVAFNETQMETIKNLVESGKTMEAQKMILTELGNEFGGSALEQTKNFSGQMEILTRNFNEVKEAIGTTLMEELQPFVKELATFTQDPQTMEFIRNLALIFGVTLKFAIESVVVVVKGLIFFFTDLFTVVFKVVDFFKSTFSTVMNTIKGIIQDVSKAVETLVNGLNRIIQLAQTVATTVKSAVGGAVSSIAGRRAEGGSVSAGSTYLVGELGPELFIPNFSGSIIPNNQLAGAGNNMSINITVTGNQLLSESAGEIISRQIMQTLKDNLRL